MRVERLGVMKRANLINATWDDTLCGIPGLPPRPFFLESMTLANRLTIRQLRFDSRDQNIFYETEVLKSELNQRNEVIRDRFRVASGQTADDSHM